MDPADRHIFERIAKSLEEIAKNTKPVVIQGTTTIDKSGTRNPSQKEAGQ
jgi:hypothetical protein